MKNNKFDPFLSLCSLCEIGITLLTTVLPDNTHLIKKSMQLKNMIIDKTQKLFITSIDREDIITLCLMLHRLNITISNLPKKQKETQKLFSHILSIITVIQEELKNNLKSSPTLFLEKCDSIFFLFENDCKSAFSENTAELYERKNLLKQYFFGRIRKCFDQAFDITDFLAMAMVKNT